ncbi:MAG: hypothetical protein GY733_10140 [bacterium]|nr:hypothetical protein [bacterium]
MTTKKITLHLRWLTFLLLVCAVPARHHAEAAGLYLHEGQVGHVYDADNGEYNATGGDGHAHLPYPSG